MNFKTIKISGVDYQLRLVDVLSKVDKEPTMLTIGDMRLANVLEVAMDNGNDWANEIDSEIYFYVENSQITLLDEELVKVLDEEYELTPNTF